jgi:hypothetical protein
MPSLEPSLFGRTIASTALVLDEFRSFRARQSKGRRADHLPVSGLSSLDAHLVAAVLEFCTEAPVLLDLASGATAGESTVLAATHPRVSKVLIGPRQADRDSAGRFLSEASEFDSCPLEMLPELDGSLASGRAVDALERHVAGGELATVCGLAGLSPEELIAVAESLMGRFPESLLLVFPMERVGDCPHLQALLSRFSHRSEHAVRILREEGEFFARSRLALVQRRDGRASAGLERLLDSYRGNCSFLDLICDRYLTAIQDADADQASLTSRGVNWLDPYQQEVADLHRQLRDKEEELAGVMPWLGRRVWQSCKWPVRKARRAVEVFRQGGFGAVCRKVARRLLG